jgi:hypothetical protein
MQIFPNLKKIWNLKHFRSQAFQIRNAQLVIQMQCKICSVQFSFSCLFFFFFFGDRVSKCSPRLASNSWSTALLLEPSKCWDYRCNPPHMALCLILNRYHFLSGYLQWQQCSHSEAKNVLNLFSGESVKKTGTLFFCPPGGQTLSFAYAGQILWHYLPSTRGTLTQWLVWVIFLWREFLYTKYLFPKDFHFKIEGVFIFGEEK